MSRPQPGSAGQPSDTPTPLPHTSLCLQRQRSCNAQHAERRLAAGSPILRRRQTAHGDGHSWTKYGERKLSPSGILREYYKCRNWKPVDLGGCGCPARKVIDQRSSNPIPRTDSSMSQMSETVCRQDKLPPGRSASPNNENSPRSEDAVDVDMLQGLLESALSSCSPPGLSVLPPESAEDKHLKPLKPVASALKADSSLSESSSPIHGTASWGPPPPGRKVTDLGHFGSFDGPAWDEGLEFDFPFDMPDTTNLPDTHGDDGLVQKTAGHAMKEAELVEPWTPVSGKLPRGCAPGMSSPPTRKRSHCSSPVDERPQKLQSVPKSPWACGQSIQRLGQPTITSNSNVLNRMDSVASSATNVQDALMELLGRQDSSVAQSSQKETASNDDTRALRVLLKQLASNTIHEPVQSFMEVQTSSISKAEALAVILSALLDDNDQHTGPSAFPMHQPEHSLNLAANDSAHFGSGDSLPIVLAALLSSLKAPRRTQHHGLWKLTHGCGPICGDGVRGLEGLGQYFRTREGNGVGPLVAHILAALHMSSAGAGGPPETQPGFDCLGLEDKEAPRCAPWPPQSPRQQTSASSAWEACQVSERSSPHDAGDFLSMVASTLGDDLVQACRLVVKRGLSL